MAHVIDTEKFTCVMENANCIVEAKRLRYLLPHGIQAGKIWFYKFFALTEEDFSNISV